VRSQASQCLVTLTPASATSPGLHSHPTERRENMTAYMGRGVSVLIAAPAEFQEYVKTASFQEWSEPGR